MITYIIKRLLLFIPVIICVSAIIFFIMDMAPGDAVAYLTSTDATAEERQIVREELGLDKHVVVRYVEYMSNLVRGDLGTSYISGLDVFETFKEKFPLTVKLALASVFVSILISIPIGIYSALHAGTLGDNASMVFALLGLSIPNFWLGLLLIITFSLQFKLFPSGGVDSWNYLVLPAITIGTGLTAALTRTTRSSMLDVIRQDYLRTVRAKGIEERVVIFKHAFRNAIIPIITVVGLQFGVCLGGAIITESIFSLPGVGKLVVDALYTRDNPMVIGCLIMETLSLGIVLLIVDLIYAWADPRVKSQFIKRR